MIHLFNCCCIISFVVEVAFSAALLMLVMSRLGPFAKLPFGVCPFAKVSFVAVIPIVVVFAALVTGLLVGAADPVLLPGVRTKHVAFVCLVDVFVLSLPCLVGLE